MAHKSYRYLYEAVKKIPSELKTAFQEVIGINQKRIVDLLLNNSAEAIIGEYKRKDRNVHFQKKQAWMLKGTLRFVNAVPQISVFSAILNLNLFLKKKRLPYSLWLECQAGNPAHVPWSHRCKIRYYRDKTHFKIGLVDKRQPKKPEG